MIFLTDLSLQCKDKWRKSSSLLHFLLSIESYRRTREPQIRCDVLLLARGWFLWSSACRRGALFLPRTRRRDSYLARQCSLGHICGAAATAMSCSPCSGHEAREFSNYCMTRSRRYFGRVVGSRTRREKMCDRQNGIKKNNVQRLKRKREPDWGMLEKKWRKHGSQRQQSAGNLLIPARVSCLTLGFVAMVSSELHHVSKTTL